ncbi:MAG TPA: hypothetical protein DIU20_09025, partial [Cryomorphaceae bacterium]|nr:hypothetical protein [Cryomorphaceae bacterium]
LFLKADGTVWGCGRNQKGQLGLGVTSTTQQSVAQAPSLSNIIAIGAGTWHSMFVAKNGSIWACGDNSEGELGDGTTTDRITPVQVSLSCCFPEYVSQDTTICQGDSLQVGSFSHFQAGVYTDTLLGAYNCDSIVTTTLWVNPSYHDSTNVTICEGDSVVVGTHAYFQSGIYNDTLPSVHFCDSILTTILQVTPSYNDSISVTICEGDSLVVGTHVYFQSGIYKDTLVTAHFCDSILTTILLLNPVYTDSLSLTIQQGDTLWVGANGYYQTGMYQDSLLTVAGCDSVVYTDLTVLPNTDIIEAGLSVSRVFPNPFSNQLNIELDRALDNGRLVLYNSLGQIVREEQGLKGTSFTLYRNQLKEGWYYLRMLEDNRSLITRVVWVRDN